MSDISWSVDSAFMELVDKPLIILGVVFASMLIVTIGMVIRSKGGFDDD